MNRRSFVQTLGGLAVVPILLGRVSAGEAGLHERGGKIVRSEEEWRRLLTPQQYHVLREEGTERPWTSVLLKEKREGTYVCAACEQPLFSSAMKYDSGTGWPSFFDVIEGAVETKRDFKLVWPRTEYHCAHCGGHQGHVFKDGPPPSGLRYCNNGLALKFVPATA